MKYRLKKDLPFAKAGSLILDLEGRPFSLPYTDCFVKMESEYGIRYSHHDSGRIFIGQLHLLEEWVEQNKPRVWTLLKAHNGDIVNATEGHNRFEGERRLGISERINVIEVLK